MTVTYGILVEVAAASNSGVEQVRQPEPELYLVELDFESLASKHTESDLTAAVNSKRYADAASCWH